MVLFFICIPLYCHKGVLLTQFISSSENDFIIFSKIRTVGFDNHFASIK